MTISSDGFATSSQPDLFQQETSTTEASKPSVLTTCSNISNVTSLPGLEDGLTRQSSPDGLRTESYGQDPHHVSRGLVPAKSVVQSITGIYGRTSFASSSPEGPLQLWENRLRARLAKIGSTESDLIWRVSVTNSGRLLSRLVPSMRPILEVGYGSLLTGLAGRERTYFWPTPVARDGKDGKPNPNIEINGLLGRVVWLYADQTEEPVALTPQFVCWLQGYPEQFIKSAPSVIRSSPELRQRLSKRSWKSVRRRKSVHRR